MGNVRLLGSYTGPPGNSGGTAFAPNEISGSTTIWDRVWNPVDLPSSLPHTDTLGMVWNVSGDGSNQIPYIDTPANLAVDTGQAQIPAPPDGNPTVLGIFYPSGFPSGRCPFIVYTNATFLYKIIYCCAWVYAPGLFNSAGNNIKWMQVESGGTPNTDHLLMFSSVGSGALNSGSTTDYRTAWFNTQGGAGNGFYGGQGQTGSGVNNLTPTNGNTGVGPGWLPSMRDQWVMYEWLWQQESTPGVSTDGYVKSWVTPYGSSTTLVNYWTGVKCNATSGDPNGFNTAKFNPYWGGGGSSAPSNQYFYVSRMRVSGHN